MNVVSLFPKLFCVRNNTYIIISRNQPTGPPKTRRLPIVTTVIATEGPTQRVDEIVRVGDEA